MGCLNLVYIAKAMPVEEAVRRYLPAMRSVVEKLRVSSGKFVCKALDRDQSELPYNFGTAAQMLSQSKGPWATYFPADAGQ